MFKRKQINLEQSIDAIQAYKKISIRFCDIKLEFALEISNDLNIYAYGAYFIGCASRYNGFLLSLDKRLVNAANNFGIKIIEV